jgi:DNA-binding MarR family transcriptional regulator
MVDINSAENIFFERPSQSRAEALREAIPALELAARAARRLEDALAAGLATAGLGAAQGRALRAIAAEPGLTVGELMSRLGISKQSLAPVLKDLIARGHVAAAGTSADRRRRLLRLTPRGEALWREAAHAALTLLADALAEEGPASSSVFERILRRLAEAEGGNAEARHPGPAS